MSVPAVLVVVPLESPARVYLVCWSFEDEQRLAIDISQRDVVEEVRRALRAACEALAGDGEEAA